MKIFISWSGVESRALAECLRAWLPRVLLTGVQTFVSSQDIEKGQRGLSVIAASLDDIDYGIILLTKANQHAPWINFESGALGKSVGEARVSPLLVDLTQADVTGPLQQFQMTSLSDRTDVWKLLQDINMVLEIPVPEDAMKVLFDNAWDELDAAITAARQGAGPAKTSRASDDILDEILFRIRRLERRTTANPTSVGPTGMTRDDERDLVDQVFAAIEADDHGEMRGGVKLGRSGPIVAVSAPESARIDHKRLQRVADSNGVRIELAEHKIIIEPVKPDTPNPTEQQ